MLIIRTGYDDCLHSYNSTCKALWIVGIFYDFYSIIWGEIFAQ